MEIVRIQPQDLLAKGVLERNAIHDHQSSVMSIKIYSLGYFSSEIAYALLISYVDYMLFWHLSLSRQEFTQICLNHI